MPTTRREFKAETSLTLNPTEIVLARDPSRNKGVFTIRNNLSTPLVYKIKSTNPAAFNLKPVQGVLAAKGSVDIHMTLLPGSKFGSQETFMVLTVATDRQNLTTEEIREIFKDTSNTIISRYLSCSILRDEDIGETVEDIEGTANIGVSIAAERLERMEQLIKASMKMQVISLVFLCFLLIGFCNNVKRNYYAMSNLWS